ncbi:MULTISPECIES: MFS transporter [Methanobacterium]|uniref:MFS transporter n=1 Tax=Methanobacterium veterum TaxID=408577 RepID=A0A9E4ZX00_9EURY|nr:MULTISPECIES: MFS transporter [Methanobacterium]MCZ3366874.1 MFS transporter [Methanobacterium veterum]MCZ3373979.1 MFS transporter [Methanobacterium veterum]
MDYVICEKCGGRYELAEGESLDNFEACQCGGTLKYPENELKEAESLENWDIPHENNLNVEETFKEVGKNDKPKFICPNCMGEHGEGIFCSKCGGRLIAVKEGKIISNTKSFDEQRLERLSDNAFRKVATDYDDYRESKNFSERINWLSIVAGVVFFVISVFTSLLLSFYLFSNSYYNYSGFIFAFSALVVLSCIFALVSGGLAAFIGISKDYDDGIINGFLVGAIASVILGFFGGISIAFMGIIVFGVLATIGGVIGIFVKKQMDE